MFVVVLTVPIDHVRAGLAYALRQGYDLLTGDIVDGEVYNIARWQVEVDNGVSVEGVGVVLHEGKGLGHWSCPCFYNSGLVESYPFFEHRMLKDLSHLCLESIWLRHVVDF